MTIELQEQDCAFLFLTESCNLRCAHCYVEAEPGHGREMAMTIVERSLSLLDDIGVRDVRLTGGEPTIHSDFSRVVRLAVDRGFRVGLVTNGVRIARDASLDSVWSSISRCWVSLYGPTAVAHARIGGRGSLAFEDVLEMVSSRSDAGMPIGVSVTVRPGETSAAFDLIAVLRSRRIRCARFVPLQPDGRGKDLDSNWDGWVDELRAFASALQQSDASRGFDRLTLNDPFDLVGAGSSPWASCLLWRRRMWSVASDGRVYPCCFTVSQPELALGSVMNMTADMLRPATAATIAARTCRGLRAGFWVNAEPQRRTCPISAMDIRATTNVSVRPSASGR